MSFLGDLSPAAGLAASAANLGQNAAAMGQQQNFYAQQAALAAQNQAALNNAYGPGGFGGATADYAAAGAAYGRAVPGDIYGGGGGGGGGGSDPFAGGAAPYQDYGIPNFGAGSQIQYKPGSVWAPGGAMAGYFDGNGDPPTSGQSYGPGYFDNTFGSVNAQQQQYAQQQPAVDWTQYFNGLTDPYSGGGGNKGGAFSGGGSIYGAQPFPNPGYTPDYSATQNGIGYPGGAISPFYDPNTYGGYGMGVPSKIEYKAGSPWAPGGSMYGWSNSGDPGPSGFVAAGGDPSYFDAGQAGSDYNPFGAINSGQVGQYNPYGGYQPPATFDQRYGQIPGQPYGQGYFDNTFGSVAGKSAYNPLAGGGYPGPMASDYQAQQQQMIRDLYQTLGIIDNAGEDSGWLYKNNSGDAGAHTLPSGNTLRPEDYFPGGWAAGSRGGG